MTHTQLNAFTRGYLETALWTATDDDSEPLDRTHDVNDIDTESIEKATADCARFQGENSDALAGLCVSDDTAGYLFWLSRNGHGHGFFAYDADTLQEAAHAYGETDLYAGDDGRLHLT